MHYTRALTFGNACQAGSLTDYPAVMEVRDCENSANFSTVKS